MATKQIKSKYLLLLLGAGAIATAVYFYFKNRKNKGTRTIGIFCDAVTMNNTIKQKLIDAVNSKLSTDININRQQVEDLINNVLMNNTIENTEIIYTDPKTDNNSRITYLSASILMNYLELLKSDRHKFNESKTDITFIDTSNLKRSTGHLDQDLKNQILDTFAVSRNFKLSDIRRIISTKSLYSCPD